PSTVGGTTHKRSGQDKPRLSPVALFLGAIPLLLGASLSVYIAFDLANRLWEQHQKLVCAHEHVAKKPGENVFDQFDTVKLIAMAKRDIGFGRCPPNQPLATVHA